MGIRLERRLPGCAQAGLLDQRVAGDVALAPPAGRSHQQRRWCPFRSPGYTLNVEVYAGRVLCGRNVGLGSAHRRLFADRLFFHGSLGWSRGIGLVRY